MSHEVETMVSAREVPWHGLGVVLPDVFTAAEGIVAGGLDWEVVKRQSGKFIPVKDKDGKDTKDGIWTPVENRFHLERTSDGTNLAVVSDVYNPFQNVEAFTFMDNLVDSGAAKYETAGSLRDGRVVFITMEMPDYMEVAGGDKIKRYLLLSTTHDGSGRIKVYVVMVRVVCMNTLTWAIAGASHSWGVTHTADVKGKVSEARDALGLSFKYSDAFKKEADRLVEITVTDDEIVALLEGRLPDKARRDDTIEAIMENYRSSATVGDYRGTAWGFINGLTEWQEHVKSNASDQAFLSRTLGGDDFKVRTDIKRRLLANA